MKILFFMFSALTAVFIQCNSMDYINNGSATLIEAVKNSDYERVTTLINDGANPNTQDSINRTLLYLATENNDLSMVDLLLNRGALVDYPFDDAITTMEQANIKMIDPTPFLYAGAHGQLDIIKRLAKANPNLNIRNYYGGNALIPAAEKGHYEVAKFLLEETDIEIDFVNYLGWTALLEVCILNRNVTSQLNMAKLLLDHGANPLTKDFDGKSSLDYATSTNNRELVILLKQYIP